MPESRGVSRRALFGAGLGRLLDERLARAGGPAGAAPAPPAADAPPPSPLGWGEGDASGLGGRLDPVHDAILAEAGAGRGVRVLVVGAGDGGLALRAAATGASVTALATDPEPGRARTAAAGAEVDWRAGAIADAPAEGFDAVVSAFAASYAPAREAAGAIVRAARPGGALVLTAWAGLLAEVLRAARTPGGPRPDAWCRYETAYRHFFDFPGLDVRQEAVAPAWADAREAVAALAAPAAPHVSGRVLAVLPGLVEGHGTRAGGDGPLRVRLAYALVTAERP